MNDCVGDGGIRKRQIHDYDFYIILLCFTVMMQRLMFTSTKRRFTMHLQRSRFVFLSCAMLVSLLALLFFIVLIPTFTGVKHMGKNLLLGISVVKRSKLLYLGGVFCKLVHFVMGTWDTHSCLSLPRPLYTRNFVWEEGMREKAFAGGLDSLILIHIIESFPVLHFNASLPYHLECHIPASLLIPALLIVLPSPSTPSTWTGSPLPIARSVKTIDKSLVGEIMPGITPRKAGINVVATIFAMPFLCGIHSNISLWNVGSTPAGLSEYGLKFANEDSFDRASNAASVRPFMSPKCAVNMPGDVVAPSPET